MYRERNLEIPSCLVKACCCEHTFSLMSQIYVTSGANFLVDPVFVDEAGIPSDKMVTLGCSQGN